MTPVEKLEAAIAKLEKQRADSNDDSRQARWNVAGTFRNSSEILSSYSGEDDGEVIASGVYTPDAHLMVTLHRTIDAQLALLKLSVTYIDGWLKGGLELGREVVALADAILGDPS